jgi:hypothetical protein
MDPEPDVNAIVEPAFVVDTANVPPSLGAEFM